MSAESALSCVLSCCVRPLLGTHAVRARINDSSSGQAHVCPIHADTSSTVHLTGCCPSASDLEKILDSPSQQHTIRDAIQRIVKADHLGTNCSEMKKPLRQHENLKTCFHFFYQNAEESLLCILILATLSKFARKFNFLALGVCCPDTTKRVLQVRNHSDN